MLPLGGPTVMGDPRIIVGYHSTGMCPTQFSQDLARAMRYSGTLIPFAIHEQSCYVDTARNNLVKHFLKTEGTHLMMMDVDLSFDASAIFQTYEILHSQGAAACYANYVLGNGGNSIFGPPENKSKEAAVLVNLQPNCIYTDISTGGTGWLMLTRELLQRMEKEIDDPWHWFGRDLTSDGKDYRGEDVTFGLRVWEMKPRPKVIGTTSLLLRHFKQMPFIPQFMAVVAKEKNLAAFATANPYEDEGKFIINGHQVIERAALTAAQQEAIEKATKGGKDGAVEPGDGEIFRGGTSQRVEEGQEGKVPEASHSDHAEREEGSQEGQEGVPTSAD